MTRAAFAAAVACAALLGRAAGAQQISNASAASGVHVQNFNFGAGSDVNSARLALVPLAYQAQLSRTVVLDGYAAYAAGRVRIGAETFDLRGPVDSWLRLRWSATPWVVAALGVNLPTGVERHSPAEAVVANVLSSDLLGFREGNWGSGASATAGLSAAHEVGRARYTMGVSYRFVGGFDPRSDTTVRYSPGNETRARLGLGMDVAGGRFDAGLTAQSSSVDRLDRKNLFQSGTRMRADLSYAVGAWSIYAADLWRAHGELTLPVINVLDGTSIRDTVTTVGWQNLALGGISTSLPIGHGYQLQPLFEAKARQRQDVVGRGWITSAGLGLPFRLFNSEVFPQAKVSRGALIPSDSSAYRSLWGAELSIVIRGGWSKR